MNKSTKTISEEKKVLYEETHKKTINQKQQKLKEDKKNNTLEQRNLGFLYIIFDHLELNQIKFSKMTGLSQQVVSWWFTTDDVNYGKICDLFYKIGYILSASFEFNFSESKHQGIQYEVNFEFETPKKYKDKIIQKAIEESRNSAIIAKLIQNKNMSLSEFSEKYDINFNSIYRWISTDSFKVSHLNMISIKTGTTIKWSLRKIQ